MAKKRLIFTLLYDDGNFMLSRNFRLQRAGNIKWLQSNYEFKRIAFSIDELIILDVSRNERNVDRFCEHIALIGKKCFVPIAAGGGITSVDYAKKIMHSGADKLVINSALIRAPFLVRELVSRYGRQCIIASVDVKREQGQFDVYVDNGSAKAGMMLDEYLAYITDLGIGEIYLNSMDRDGTGHGYLFEFLEKAYGTTMAPLIIAGGAGNWHHLLEGLRHQMVDAVATANLFNFIGQGFPNARSELLKSNMDLAQWKTNDLTDLEDILQHTNS